MRGAGEDHPPVGRFIDGIVVADDTSESLQWPYVLIFEPGEDAGYRRISLSTISRLEIGGEEYLIRE